MFSVFSSSSVRTKLLESEAMNESLRRQATRLSSRPTFPSSSLSPAPGHPPGSSPSPMSMEAEMTDVLRRAKLDIERLKKKERRQRRMRLPHIYIIIKKKKTVSQLAINLSFMFI